MIATCRYWPRGEVTHKVDVKWLRQRHFFTLCGKYKHYDDLAAPRSGARDCKTCVRIASYHMRKPPPVTIDLRKFFRWRDGLKEP